MLDRQQVELMIMREDDDGLVDDDLPKNSFRIRIRCTRTEAAAEDQAATSPYRRFFSGTDDGELAGDQDGGKGDDESLKEDEDFVGGGVSSRRTDASRANPACPECGKRFPSDKSLFGHLRCHPERDYRGANPPPPQSDAHRSFAARALPATAKWPTARRGRKRPAAAAATCSDPVAKKAASILLLLADSKPITRFDAADELDRFEGDGDEDYCNSKSISNYKRSKKLKMPESSPPPVRGRRTYRCSLCLKVFTSHQALGGHRASHNKRKSVAAEEAPLPPPKDEMVDEGGAAVATIKVVVAVAEHRCKVCNMAFVTGQALGLHRRRHFNEQSTESGGKAANNEGPSSSLQYSSELEHEGGSNGFFDFDLNEVPRLE